MRGWLKTSRPVHINSKKAGFMDIGGKLFKYQGFSQFGEYTCTAVLKRESLTEYEMECQNCTHGFKCKVLVKKVPNQDCYEFLTLVNCETDEWRGWHDKLNPGEEFYETLIEAKRAVYKNACNEISREISKFEDGASSARKRLAEMEAHLKNVG